MSSSLKPPRSGGSAVNGCYSQRVLSLDMTLVRVTDLALNISMSPRRGPACTGTVYNFV